MGFLESVCELKGCIPKELLDASCFFVYGILQNFSKFIICIINYDTMSINRGKSSKTSGRLCMVEWHVHQKSRSKLGLRIVGKNISLYQ